MFQATHQVYQGAFTFAASDNVNSRVLLERLLR